MQGRHAWAGSTSSVFEASSKIDGGANRLDFDPMVLGWRFAKKGRSSNQESRKDQ